MSLLVEYTSEKRIIETKRKVVVVSRVFRCFCFYMSTSGYKFELVKDE